MVGRHVSVTKNISQFWSPARPHKRFGGIFLRAESVLLDLVDNRSSFRVPDTKDGAPLARQNQDLEPEYANVAILLRVSPNDGRPRALMFTFAGQLGYSGMNHLGVAHFANALYDFEWRPGLPIIRSSV